MTALTESGIERAALAWLERVGWGVAHGPEIAPSEPGAERADWREVILEERLRRALVRLNPDLPAEALEDAQRKLLRIEGASLLERNRNAHRLIVDGVTVEHRSADGRVRGELVRVVDFEHPEANDFLAVDQLTVVEGRNRRRADIVLYLNGLPVGVIELKNPADEQATLRSAHAQLQTYQEEIPALFVTNVVLLVSDGLEARVGPLAAGFEWFKPWRTIEGNGEGDTHASGLEMAIRGLLAPRRLVSFLRDFVLFEDDGSGRIVKKLAGYHQFHAVGVAVEETLRAVALRNAGRSDGRRHGGTPGDRRIGVVWHTQGSGKSLTMLFYAGRIVREPAMENPTIVVLTDRNDLDDQLFATFARGRDLLRQTPVQAESRAHLRRLLDVQAGGIVFTTIQKFMPDTQGDRHPKLSERRNIVVIADEAHRSQYDFIDGFARHLRDALPNASFIGFTGTPIELEDANTRQVFGDYISVYDIEQAVKDGATVPIYYESRLAKLALDDAERPRIDPDFEEVTEGEEVERKEQLKKKWAQLEAIVGAPRRIELLARDIVEHFERRLEVLDGKGMIVAMSRRICVDLYDAIRKIRPDWCHPDDRLGSLKVVMTGSASDPAEWQEHIRNKPRREALARRFRDPADPFRLVIVRDMWLTGFDAPSLHTLYLDKPMRGHGLMQAIARVNRVFRDKPGGLVVDYLGLAQELKQALATYTASGGHGRTAIDQEEAVAVLKEKFEICRDLFHGFDWSAWAGGSSEDKLRLIRAALEHLLGQRDGRERCLKAVRELSQAFALAVPHEEALRIRDDVAFFQSVRSCLVKRAPGEPVSDEDLEHAVREIVARAIAPEGVVDIFAAAGLAKPDISILSEKFLAQVRCMPYRNLAVELLRKLLKGAISERRRKNLVQARSFAELLEDAIRRYQNRSLAAAQVIEELIALAKQIRDADTRHERLGMSEDEVAFYDALKPDDGAVAVLGEDTLRTIVRELIDKLRKNISTDWMIRENARANLRVLVKRILRAHGYPLEKLEEATQTVLEQTELLSDEWLVKGA